MGYYPHEVDIRAEDLVGQWVLTSTEYAIPSGWQVSTHGRWTLACSPPLDCLPLRTARGATIGWFIGHAVTDAGVLLRAATMPVLPPDSDVGTWVDSLNGRFAVVDLRGAAPRLYPDGLATLAGVFSSEDGVAASTSGLIPRSNRTPFLVDRILAVDAPYRGSMYPLGMTPRRGVERILPNHVLDCAAWTLVRRWPLGPFSRMTDPAPVVGMVAAGVRQALEGVSEVYPLHVSLTGGHDSRLMLSCARELLGNATIYTADLGDRVSWLDVTIASRIAARFGLAHRVLRERATASDLRTWLARTGGETGEPRGWRGARALADQPAGRATITGTVADMPKLVGWRKIALRRPVTPEAILQRCAVGFRPEFIARAEQWLGALPPLDQVAIADVFHMEQVKGCWSGTIEYGELGHSSARLCPMTRRDMLEGAVRLPLEYRLNGQLHHDVMALHWPELLEFPFNDELPIPAARSRVFTAAEAVSAGLERYRRAIRRRWTRIKAARSSPMVTT